MEGSLTDVDEQKGVIALLARLPTQPTMYPRWVEWGALR